MNRSPAVHSSWVVGFALFSMFFGSGNLMFPMFIGQEAGSAHLTYLGFVVTGVLVPFLGVLAMLALDGISNRFFALLGKRGAFVVMTIVLCAWIPFGAGPRCIVLAYSSLAASVWMPPLIVFVPIYSLIVVAVCLRPSWFVQILGKYLTPAFLICISLVIGVGLGTSRETFQGEEELQASFLLGLLQGYNTQDLIAALFFSAALFAKMGESDPVLRRKKVLKGSLVGMGLLAVVYYGLVLLASAYHEQLEGIPKDRLLAHAGTHVLGANLGFISALAIALACITTSMALCQVFADFIASLRPAVGRTRTLALSAAITSVLAFGGLETIMAFSAPLVQVIYPLLIVMVFIHFFPRTVKVS